MIRLVTDSTAYLPDDVRSKYDVRTASLKVNVGDQTYDEEGGITKAEFYRLLADVSTAPTTSHRTTRVLAAAAGFTAASRASRDAPTTCSSSRA